MKTRRKAERAMRTNLGTRSSAAAKNQWGKRGGQLVGRRPVARKKGKQGSRLHIAFGKFREGEGTRKRNGEEIGGDEKQPRQTPGTGNLAGEKRRGGGEHQTGRNKRHSQEAKRAPSPKKRTLGREKGEKGTRKTRGPQI